MNRRLCIGFLACLWLVCLYRAITQSIVHDEALTYELYIAAPLSCIFSYFDANHHFLNTLLMRLSVALVGVSEWALRVPALESEWMLVPPREQAVLAARSLRLEVAGPGPRPNSAIP